MQWYLVVLILLLLFLVIYKSTLLPLGVCECNFTEYLICSVVEIKINVKNAR